mmetsp:Transcript_4619/g.13358  ORF Transcript_4619/g.13358 Transcript_4619/m.13358 type:complete len:341 (+) Transcript_4619:109-1131(+)
MSLTFPTDKLPYELMLPHQLRMVTSMPNSSLQVLVVDNRPPDYGPGPSDAFLDSVRAEKNMHVMHSDYDHKIDDPAFLARFFTFPEAKDPEGMTIRKATQNRRFPNEMSNLLGMLTLMTQCLDADDDIELCSFLDSDIFVYRRPDGPGMLDMAPAMFDQNPKLIILEPPLLCLHETVAMDSNGVCKEIPPLFDLSQRHMIIHRQRLKSILPLATPWNMTNASFWGTWEKIMTNQMREIGGSGVMQCGYETVVTHPSLDVAPHLTYEEHFEELAKFGGDFPSIPGFNDTYGKGTAVFIDRYEAGKFETELSLREMWGTGPDTRYCMSMRPEKARVDAGLAY